ncbi:MAG: ABC transporter ATP-binding protein [Puniceicoccales bacterium]|jgi:ABC-type Mn2+/Zn2+ transport system ATPase subunit|nr:ABC transporter ATP-binding protein [Puniceicoccales bacterium]
MYPLFRYSSAQSPSTDGTFAVETQNLAVAPQGCTQPILTNINLQVPHGCRAALVGANGTGKSTILKTIAGLLPLRAGQILVDGVEARCGNPRLAYLAQRHLIEWHFPITVRQAVLAGRYSHLGWFGRPHKVDREKATQAMHQLGLDDLANRPLDALSGGQQQRVLIARALCQEATLLLLDEPFNGLDTTSRQILDSFFADEASRNLTILMATHEIAEAEKRFDLILRIQDERLAIIHACTCKK